MSVQGVSSGTNPYLPNVQSSSATMSSNFKNLVNAVQSGDLKSAQNAFSQIEGLLGKTQTPQAVAAPQSSGQQNQLSADFAALGKALQSGDIGGAQDALKKLGQDLQPSNSTAKAHHHHHHHGGKPPSDATASSTAASSTAATSDSTSSSGANLDVLI